MPGGIDHLVLCVADLEQARDVYRRLGFTLTPPGRHPFGTANSLVQLAERSFLELLTVADPTAIPQMQPGFFSFGAFNRDFLLRQEGCSMLVLESVDAEADAKAWISAGLGAFAPFHFERPAKLPDGTIVTVAFTLAFAVDPRLPDVAFFACQQHTPELFWKAEYQRHANGALGIDEVALVAAEPQTLAELLETLTGVAAEPIEEGIVARTSRGALLALTPEMFARRYAAVAPPLDRGPRLAGCRIGIEDAQALKTRLDKVGIRFSEAGAAIVIPPSEVFGLTLGFVQRSKA
jgi:hypothetical protein